MSYAVIEVATLKIVKEYSGDAAPDYVVWPTGEAAHAVYPGLEHGDYRFVAVVRLPESPGEFYQIGALTRSLDGGVFTFVQRWEPVNLAFVQAALRSRIDEQAEQARAKYITLGSGQALTYQDKLAEARALIEDSDPANERYPMLAATIGPDGATLQEVAKSVLQSYGAWTAMGAAIEKIRRRAKAEITQAQDVNSASAAYSAVLWP